MFYVQCVLKTEKEMEEPPVLMELTKITDRTASMPVYESQLQHLLTLRCQVNYYLSFLIYQLEMERVSVLCGCSKD